MISFEGWEERQIRPWRLRVMRQALNGTRPKVDRGLKEQAKLKLGCLHVGDIVVKQTTCLVSF